MLVLWESRRKIELVSRTEFRAKEMKKRCNSAEEWAAGTPTAVKELFCPGYLLGT